VLELNKSFQPSLMFISKAVSYYRVKPLLQLGRLLAVPTNIGLGWKGLPGTNTSLLGTFVNYDLKKFYNTDTRSTRELLLASK